MPHQCKQTTCRRAPPGPRADNPVHWSAIMARKWIGIRASGGLAIAGSLATLVLGGLMLFGMTLAPPPKGPAAPPFSMAAIGIAMASIFVLFSGWWISSRITRPPPPSAPAAPPFSMAAIGIAMASIFALFSGWGIWTAIAIFRRRGWARISILIFAVLLTFMGVGAGLAVIVVQLPAQPNVTQSTMNAIRWGMAGFYGMLAAIGVWWLVLFNLRSTKEYFVQEATSAPPARPLSVSVIGWYLLMSSLFLAVPAVMRLPTFVFGSVVTGWAGAAVYTVFAAAQVILGVGLLRLRERARVGAIVYFCVMALNSVVTWALPGYEAKVQLMFREMPKLFPAGAPAQMPQPMWVFMLMGIAFLAIPVWFLVRRRAAFVKVADAPPSPL